MSEALATIGLIVFFAFLAWVADKLEEIGKKTDEKEIGK